MANKVVKKESRRVRLQMREITFTDERDHNSRDAAFLSDENFTEIALSTTQSPKNKEVLLTN